MHTYAFLKTWFEPEDGVELEEAEPFALYCFQHMEPDFVSDV
jgi:hypothetical protein